MMGATVGEAVGKMEGHVVLGAPVSLEPLAIDGYAVEGVSEGETVGIAVCSFDDDELDADELDAIGAVWRVGDGELVGDIEGHAVLGAPVSLEPLAIDGYAVDGVSEGESVGVAVGPTLGISVGVAVGPCEGRTEGHAVLGAPVPATLAASAAAAAAASSGSPSFFAVS
jgi:hypothetical protein